MIKNDDSLPLSPAQPEEGDSRRQFLHQAGAVVGALVLTRALPAEAQNGGEAVAPAPVAPSLILNLSEHKDLEKVGGWEIVEVGAERVIVAHTESGFSACSSVCPHKRCDVEYRLADKQFVCPCHNSRFDEAGKVLKGPARTDLKPFDIASALVVKAKGA